MTRLLQLTVILAITASSFLVFSSWSEAGDTPRQTESGESGLVTLYMNDPITKTFGFKTGGSGGLFQDHMAKNRQSDIDFGNYHPGSFTVGIEGGTEGEIIDLGHFKALGKRYGFSETVGGGQGFASIRFRDEQLVILKDYEKQSTQQLNESDSLFKGVGHGYNSAKVEQGHVYLMRLTADSRRNEIGPVVKFLVVAHTPNQSVTIRWVLIRR